MTHLEGLLDRYDAGTLNRRQLLGALAGLVVAGQQSSAPAIAPARRLNHATLFVRDVAKSQEFYQRLFGMPVLTAQSPGVNLAVGSGFIGLYPAENGDAPRIDHVCFGVDRFDADTLKRKLGAEGVDAIIRDREETKELYFADPNGIRIQLQDVRYRGGVGPLGDRNPSRS
jgi:catechol 2,3-dioxygenase-like lactoylglutathione lyase family enzyme